MWIVLLGVRYHVAEITSYRINGDFLEVFTKRDVVHTAVDAATGQQALAALDLVFYPVSQ